VPLPLRATEGACVRHVSANENRPRGDPWAGPPEIEGPRLIRGPSGYQVDIRTTDRPLVPVGLTGLLRYNSPKSRLNPVTRARHRCDGFFCQGPTNMRKLLLAGVLMLAAVPVARAEVPHCKDVPPGTPCWRESTAEELKAILNSPSHAYAKKDYIWDCVSYAGRKDKGPRGCVVRNCRSHPPEVCAGGKWGHVPRKLRKEQIRDLGRIPQERYVKESEHD
jgi:hypothetical protein